MALPSRKYFSLPKVAEILNCTVEDIIHWGAISAVKIGIPYESDGFDPPHIYDEDDLDKYLYNYRDFAFIPSGYLFTAELDGYCTFTSLELTDGRFITFHPSINEFSEWVKFADKGFDFSKLFIIKEDLEKLQTYQKNFIENPLIERERKTLLTMIAVLAKEAGLDITKISKTAELIANMSQLMDTPIGATTIETHLRKINQAI